MQNITQEQVPLMVVATGVMKQQAILSAFLGTVVEEKFHMSPLSMSILPCKPFIRDSLRPMIVDHPDLAPIRFGRGCKEGFFIVNLSAEQDFTEEPAEFREMGNQTNARSNDGQMGMCTLINNSAILFIQYYIEDFEEAIVEGGQNTMHNDEDEIQNETNNRPAQRAPRQRNFDDFEAEEVVESATEAFVRTMGARRFSDCSNEDSDLEDIYDEMSRVQSGQMSAEEYNANRGILPKKVLYIILPAYKPLIFIANNSEEQRSTPAVHRNTSRSEQDVRQSRRERSETFHCKY